MRLETSGTVMNWKALPDKGLAEKTKAFKGGKKSKLLVTITFFVKSAGESECPPVVIWKSENPRCFKGVKKSEFPVWYFSQKKSWMEYMLMQLCVLLEFSAAAMLALNL